MRSIETTHATENAIQFTNSPSPVPKANKTIANTIAERLFTCPEGMGRNGLFILSASTSQKSLRAFPADRSKNAAAATMATLITGLMLPLSDSPKTKPRRPPPLARIAPRKTEINAISPFKGRANRKKAGKDRRTLVTLFPAFLSIAGFLVSMLDAGLSIGLFPLGAKPNRICDTQIRLVPQR